MTTKEENILTSGVVDDAPEALEGFDCVMPPEIAKKIKDEETKQEYLKEHFSYHPPKGNQVKLYEKIRKAQRHLAEVIFDCCPDTEVRKEALKFVESAGMWANKSIAVSGFDKELEESNLVSHARRELKLAGLFDKDSDYGGMIGDAVMKLVETHSQEGHSGFSHSWTLNVFNKVANFKTLTPITNNPEEWMHVGMDTHGEVYQNRRCSTFFSYDKGQTWYDIDDPEKKNWPKKD